MQKLSLSVLALAAACTAASDDDDGGAQGGGSATSGADGGSEAGGNTEGSGGEGGTGTDTGGGEGGSSGTETGEPGATDSDSGGPGGHECTAPDPALDAPPCSAGGSESEPNDQPSQASAACLDQDHAGQVAFVDDVDIFEFTTPPAPYGGYVVASIHDLDTDAVLELEIRSAEDNQIIEDDADLTAGANRTVWFAAEPEQAFRAFVREYITEDVGAYTFTARWIPTPDCYEPNNSRQDAKWIPVGDTIEALMMAGYTDAGSPGNARYADWYRVQLDAGPVELRLRDVAANAQMDLQLFDEDGTDIDRDFTIDHGAGLTINADVEPGEYHIMVGVFIEPTADGTGTDVADHFVNAYALTVEQ